MTTINTNYNPMLYSFGMPLRLKGGTPFALKSNIKTYSINETKIVGVPRQVENFNLAMHDEPGWMMYVVASGLLDKAKHVAANIAQSYLMRDKKMHWITNFDQIKQISFAQMQLIVIDALLFDSSPYRRDKVYEIINYNCNVPNLSVLVIAQNTDPLAVANQLAMKPNLAMLLK